MVNADKNAHRNSCWGKDRLPKLGKFKVRSDVEWKTAALMGNCTECCSKGSIGILPHLFYCILQHLKSPSIKRGMSINFFLKTESLNLSFKTTVLIKIIFLKIYKIYSSMCNI